MQFDKQNDKGENYALLFPQYEDNEELKKMAEDIGARNALQFDREERGYRLYEAKLPEKIDVDKAFGKYATEEAKLASQAERDDVLAKKAAAAEATGTNIDESKIYYPAKGNGDREQFNEMRKDSETQFYYSSRQGGFVHKDGPTEGFEKFQTKEAKAAWQEEAGKSAETTKKRRDNASDGINVTAERANGRVFLADNAQGFMLPSKKNEEVRDSQLAAMKEASPEELAQVFKITEAAKKALDRKLYGIQLNAAKTAGVDKAVFDKMPTEKRREAADFKGLDGEEFSKLVSLTSGFFSIRENMIERGMIESKETARETQKSTSKSSGAAGGKQEGKSQPSGKKSAEKADGKKQVNKMAAQLQAGSEAQGVGR